MRPTLRAWTSIKIDSVAGLGGRGDPPALVEPMIIPLRPDAIPVKCKQQRYSPLHKSYLKEHISELLNNNLIRPAERPEWLSPVFVVPKPNGKLRMTIDLCAVNKQTLPKVFPPPPLPDLEAAPAVLKGAKFFGQYDLFRGYWQFPLDEASQDLLAFLTPERGL